MDRGRFDLEHRGRSDEMAHFVGLDVSVKETSVCVVDNAGKVILEQQGDYQEFRARRGDSTDQAMAMVKRSPNRTANWDLAMDHSRGGMIHCFSERFNTRKRSFVAAASLGK